MMPESGPGSAGLRDWVTPPTHETPIGHVHPTQENGAAFVRRDLRGPVVMLNLLRFRDVADYTSTPELAPDDPISGRDAYRRYERSTMPFLRDVGGEVVFVGAGDVPMIGPLDERWDLVLLVRYPSPAAFLSMTGNAGYLAGVGHRTAALEDSRLVPLEPSSA